MEAGQERQEEKEMEAPETEPGSASIEADIENSSESIIESEVVCADGSEYFNGLNGEAVIYDPSNGRLARHPKNAV